MDRTEILKIIKETGADYSIYGGKYAVVDMHDNFGERIDLSDIPVECMGETTKDGSAVTVVWLDEPPADDVELYDVYRICGCYDGQ